MVRRLKWIYLTAVFALVTLSLMAERLMLDFNRDWSFARYGQMPDGRVVAEPANLYAADADTSGWRTLNLPHDWGIEGPFRMDLPNDTGKLPWAGIGWYRKSFQCLETDRNKRIFIDFDGAMSHAQVWLNGEYIGGWPYGYSSFRLELTDHIRFGEDNVIAVRLDNPPESSRWYPGSGIYRNVRLVKTAPVHIAHWGTFVTTPDVTDTQATVRVATTVDNQSDISTAVTIHHEIVSEKNPTVVLAQQTVSAGEIAAGGSFSSEVSISLTDFVRWDIEHPDLYILRTSVIQDGQTTDTEETVFGIRTIEFIADKGFFLNGRHLKLNGVCMHHDLGPLGTAVNRRAIERQLEILKEMGCNAIRTSHNPPAPELLDLCDRMGFLVMVEAFDCWAIGKKENDYSTLFPEWYEKDLTALVHRDRNHPSVIIWSTGNEIPEMGGKTFNPELSRRLTGIIHREDPSRPVTVGCNNPKAGFNGFEETMDVFGFNYKPHLYAEFREKHPGIPLYGSETASCISSRGEYFFPVLDDKDKGAGGYFQVSSYDLYAPRWATKPDVEFEMQDRMPEVFGEFVWTGFDYIGEPTPYNKDKTNLLNFGDPEDQKKMAAELERLGGNIPSRSSYFGIVDLCGFPKDRFYLYQSKWRPDLPMVHVLPHWNWPERVGMVTPVHIYTSGDETELFLNGKSLGRKKKATYEYRLCWNDVVYEPGELRAVAYKNGQLWAEQVMATVGSAKKILLSADRTQIQADGCDLSFITVTIADEAGRMVPRADCPVEFEISGAGEILAVGNGNPASHESFHAHQHKAFNGLCLVVVRSLKNQKGAVILTARADGLEDVSLTLQSR